jgi:hypothetical protein
MGRGAGVSLKRMSLITRLVSATRERRLLSGLRRHYLTYKDIGRERVLRDILKQPRVMPRRLPSIRLNGDFSSGSSALIKMAFESALTESRLPTEVRKIKGMSGQRYRSFINLLVGSYPEARYLEVGSAGGSTATAALHGNRAKALCIDNWSQFGGPRSEFFANIEKVRSPDIDFSLLEDDFRSVCYDEIGRFNIYFFDGPHEEKDHYDGIVLAQPAAADSHVLIVDDWNWLQVRIGTLRALIDSKCRIECSIEIRTTLNNKHAAVVGEDSEWHNGSFIGLIRKPLMVASCGPMPFSYDKSTNEG